MKVFISWSGSMSHDVARVLRDWLPDVLQNVEAYVSSEDIRKGNRWSQDIAEELAASNHGIVCLTADNLGSPWINFEAGALSKTVNNASLWTLLINVAPTDVQGPLTQFQHTRVEHDDFFRLMTAINERLAEAKLGDGRLQRVFDKFWPELESKIREVVDAAPEQGTPERSDKALLEELVELGRSTARMLGDLLPGEAEKRVPGSRDNFRTTVTIIPGQSEAVVEAYRERVRQDESLRKYGIVATGGGGVGGPDGVTESYNVWIQAFRPVSKKRLLELAAQLGIEVVDVTYSRITFN